MHGEREPVGGEKAREVVSRILRRRGARARTPAMTRWTRCEAYFMFHKGSRSSFSVLTLPTSQRLALGVQMRASTEKPGAGFWNWISR